MSLNNEKQRRQSSTKKTSDVDDSLQTSRAYNTDGSNAFNIFEEKVVDSRLRPRTGPRRAYNYIDADSSEDDMKQNVPRFSRRRGYSFSEREQDSPDRLHQRQIKREMLEEESRRCRKPNFKRRSILPNEESDGSDDNGKGSRENSFTQYHNRPGAQHNLGLRTSKKNDLKRSLSPGHKENEEESEKEMHSVRQKSTRLKQKQEQEQQHSSDEEPMIERKPRPRTRMASGVEDLGEDDEDEETEHLRRSSRKRRQIFDTLNQSYIVNMPGRREQDNVKDEESGETELEEEEENGNNQEYSDMYSRVKRKRVQVKRNMYGVPIHDDTESEEDDENANNNNDDDEEEEEEEEEENVQNQSGRVLRKRKSIQRPQPQRTVKSYSLRQHKPRTDLYKAPVEERRVRRVERSVFATTPTKNTLNQPYQSPAHRRKIRKKSAFHSSSSSTSSSDSETSDEKSFKRRKAKSMAKARNRMMPMNMTADTLASSTVLKDRVKSGVSLADVEPMNIDKSVTFDSIGGLGKHIRKLKEMVVFPLLYDKVFQRFKVDPPRGVLFYGPPGTGKTLVARALANECSQGDRRVAFFMRKGADCLSKWVGESERQLRLLFDQAYKFRPSIIFFDEIDGLAPVRSSRQDQIHSSIVSTLLALMDGLDSRGEIVVIGATNRIDSLDPALRRPGRFDREFLFPLPSLEARKQILKIHTNSWSPKLNDRFLSELAEKCVGYCGADLKALCTETAMQALRRRYPQIYLTNEALQLDVSSINVTARDFYNAIVSIIPTSQRSISTPARALPTQLVPLLEPQLNSVMTKLKDIFPASLESESSFANAVTLNQAKELAEGGIPWDELLSDEEEDAPSIFIPSTPVKMGKSAISNSMEHGHYSSQHVPTYLNFASCATTRPTIFRPRLMLVGCEGQGQTTHLAPAVIHQMENLPCHVLDLPTLYAVTAKTPEESCANVFHEAKRKCPSILYLPYMDQWWDVMADTLRATLLTLIHDLDPALPLLLLATSERPYHMLDPTLRSLFSSHSSEVSMMRNPNKEERHDFFRDLLLTQASKAPPQKKQAETMLKFINLRSNGSRKRKKSKQFKQPHTNYLPNFIYPFGKFENYDPQSENTEQKAGNVLKVTEKSSNSRMSIPLKKKLTSLVKLEKLNLKLYRPPAINPCHRMVLRSKVHSGNHLNSNQSARSMQPSINCAVYKSRLPAVRSDRFTRLRSLKTQNVKRHSSSLLAKDHSTIIKKKGFKQPFMFVKRKVRRSYKRSCKITKSQRLRPLPKSNSKNWHFSKQELSSRHERYVRRLQRLEAKMSEMTNGHPSNWINKLDFFTLSARHLRYLRRLKRVESALQKASSAKVVQGCTQQHHLFGSSALSSLSCGSFQMLYKKNDNYLKHERNLNLPLNLNALNLQQSRTKKKSKRSVLQEEHLCKNSSSMEPGHSNYLFKMKGKHCAQRMLESLPLAAPPKPKDLSPEELALLEEKEELTLMELRIFLRDVLNKLGTDKKFSIFAKPVNIEDAADYYDIIEHPMDLSSMMAKIDLHEYSTVRDFLNDIDLICSNALEYNPDRGPMDRVIRHRACALKDTAYAIIKTELDKEFEKTCVEIQESRKRRGQKSSTVPNFYNTRLRHGHSNRSQATAPSTSYLEKPQITRSIPKPDGERFSRRVRGLDTDPVPSLETVEKVFKSSRLIPSPSRENLSNSKIKESMADGSIKSKKEENVKDNENQSDSDCVTNLKQTPQSLKHFKNSDVEESSENIKTNTNASSVGNSRKKRPSCVWCRPRRKRRRLNLSKAADKAEDSEKDVVGESNEEDGEESMNEEEEEDVNSKKQTSSKIEIDQQLTIDTTECAAKTMDDKNLEHKTKSPLRPASGPLGVNTRRSSMSPRMTASTSQPSKTLKNLEKSYPEAPLKDTVKTNLNADEDKISNKDVKGLLKSSNECSSSSQSQGQATNSVESAKSDTPGELAVKDRPSVVKRLDLDMVITDSGHGSSLESNGDSRDSTDHKNGMRVEDESSVSKSLPAIEALINVNHNCSSDTRTTATGILATSSQTVITNIPRLTQLLNRLVACTDGYTIERLEKIYSQLSQLIYRHRSNYDKLPLIEAMESKVENLTNQTVPGTSKL